MVRQVGAFEISHRDGMGRIGKLTTLHGEITTPTLMPVIDPSDIILSPKQIRREFGADLVITNAYLTLRHFGKTAAEHGIHGVLKYDGPVMTDSVTGDAELLIREAGKIRKITIEQLFDEAKNRSACTRENNFQELDVEVLAIDKNLKVKWVKASRVTRRWAEEPILTITTIQGRSINITEGHSLFTFNDGDILPIKGGELKVNDFIIVPAALPLKGSGLKVDKLSIKWYRTRKNVEVLFDDTFMTFLGLWLADGSYSPQRVGLSCANDPECLKIVRIIADRFGRKLTVEDNGVDCNINSTSLQRVMVELGFVGKSSTKRVPQLIYNLNEEQIGSFLRGYFSGDGFVSKKCVGSYSTNDKLNHDIQSLLLALGILSNMSSAGYEKGLKKHSLRIYSRCELGKFQEKVNFIQRAKRVKLREIIAKLNGKKRNGINVRGIPHSTFFGRNSVLKRKLGKYRLRIPHASKSASIVYSCRTFDRELLKGMPEFATLYNSEILFLPVAKIDRSTKRCYVYDIEVPSLQNFICSNVVVHNSGGYQILRYGEIDVGSEEIVRYQDAIAPDIATILDVPTGAWVSRERAAETIRTTLERAKQAIELRSNPKVMWCGPIQGGMFSDLVAECAIEIGKLDYQLHAIGSPVELLENYRYAEIVDLVMAAKQHLPLDRPTHLFGAGHPMVLALATVMGCDLFDSAAYVLYARDGRYMTQTKTLRLDSLDFLPCECPVCVENSLREIKDASTEERVKLLARHNLHVTFGELRRIRQAIIEGRLWEHVEMRCRAHPRLLDGLRRLAKYREFVEHFDPVSKPSAFYYLGPESAGRPEVIRHEKKLAERYEPPALPILALVPTFEREKPKVENPEQTHLVRLVPPFGVVPEELEEVYPLGQFQVPQELDAWQIKTVVDSLSNYLQKYSEHYEQVLLFDDPRRWGSALIDACKPVAGKLRVFPLSGARKDEAR